jgi:hypothetical protein
MACAEFEELLIDYQDLPFPQRAKVDAHLAGCADCREYKSILQQLDGELSAQYSGVTPLSELQARIHSRIAAETRLARLSFLPEILDFIGGAAIVAIVFSLAWMFVPREATALADALPLAGGSLALAGAALAAATWAGVRAYADLK